jgi:hypothetical protein
MGDGYPLATDHAMIYVVQGYDFPTIYAAE